MSAQRRKPGRQLGRFEEVLWTVLLWTEGGGVPAGPPCRTHLHTRSMSTFSLVSHLVSCHVSLSPTFLICKVGPVTPGDGPSCDFCRVNRGWVPSTWGLEGHPSLRSWE